MSAAITEEQFELQRVPERVDLEELKAARVHFLRGWYSVWAKYVANFESQHGQILLSYYSIDGPGAVVLTNGHPPKMAVTPGTTALPELLYVPPSELSPEFTQVLFLADQILFEARQSGILSPRRMELSFEMIYSALTYLFKLADDLKAKQNMATIPSSAYAVTSTQLNSARSYYLTGELRRQTLLYLIGIVSGSVILASVAVLVFTLGRSIGLYLPQGVDPGLVTTSLIAGGLGAIFSVMLRMSRGQLSLSRDLSSVETGLVGGFRPLIGVISGGLLYVLILSGLLPIRPSGQQTGEASVFGFYAILAFIAGFSERFVQDALSSTENQLAAGTSMTPLSKSAGLPPGMQS